MEAESKLFSDHHILIHRVMTRSDDGPLNLRLDAFLKKQYKNRSREQIKKAIDSGAITVIRANQNQPVGKIKASTQLFTGDQVHVLTKRKKEPRVNFNYKILHEDEWILVVDKPGNLPVHPAGKFYFHTLLIHLRTEGFEVPLEAKRQFYLPHRIDRETSGVMVLAKTPEVAADLVDQFAQRKTQKKYIAITHGHLPDEPFTVCLPLGRKQDSRIRVKMHEVSVENGGLEAITVFKKIENFKYQNQEMSLVECELKTGRQHQIRAHLSLKGHPIVGDKLYGLAEQEAVQFFDVPGLTKKKLEPSSSNQTIEQNESEFILQDRYISAETSAKLITERHCLHATLLSLTHPKTQKKVTFESKLPSDMQLF